MLYPVGLLRGGNYYLFSHSITKQLSKLIDPVSKLPVISNILMNDVYALVRRK